MNRRRTLTVVVVVALLALLGWAIASPLLALQGLQKAILNKDTAAIERYVDFDQVRANLNIQLKEKVRQQLDSKNENSLGRLATMFSGGLINQLVNRLVTPEGIANFGADAMKNGGQQGSVEAAKQWRIGLMWPLGLRIYNPQNGGAGLRLQPQGLGWKVVAMDLG